MHEQLQARLGRVPTDDEFKAECQTRCGDRGMKLAYKGWSDRSKSNVFADEELVVLAVQAAVLRGLDVVILSRDLDVEEQFSKMMGFFQHDYSAMLVAERYRSNPAGVGFMPGRWPPFTGYVEDEDVLLWKTDLATVESLKPAEYKAVCLHSVVVGDHEGGGLKVTPLSFGAETGLRRLLAIKSSTRGLNSDGLAGRNCGIGSIRNSRFLAPIICRDTMVPLGSTIVPALDKRFATCVDESVASVEWLTP